MKKALLYSILLLSVISCIEQEEVIIPGELEGKWEKEFSTEEDSWEHIFEFKSNGTYESISIRNIPTEELQPGILDYSKGNYSKIDGKLVLSSISHFYAENYLIPPSEIGLLKEQLEWVIPDEVAEFSLEEDNTILVVTFLGCNDVLDPRARIANCAPPTPMAYKRVLE
ncbi:hypothetical protein SAMN00777080_0746 [Aquiflexum balticum DSM 16537]|uniref:Lipocalin-like domain-containing protein n=1 Tax=Aquiflexum balticum DSM 16537 TaxID=758820 RepID=A0A1W2H139_9BACT|nr:hypothetical protein [Aquiflexum balticum]SMD42206.1 hypothetical protein SAMN00777080_0746 [Aquiflexum balticum DSM 16537]